MTSPIPNPVIAALSQHVLPPIALMIDEYNQPLKPTRTYSCRTPGLQAIYLDKSGGMLKGSFVFETAAQTGEVARRILSSVINGELIEIPHLNSAEEASRTLSYRSSEENASDLITASVSFLYSMDQKMRGAGGNSHNVPIFELRSHPQNPQ